MSECKTLSFQPIATGASSDAIAKRSNLSFSPAEARDRQFHLPRFAAASCRAAREGGIMAKLHFAVASLLLAFFGDQAAAQSVGEQWTAMGSNPTHPAARGSHFDLAFGPDQLPVLASFDSANLALSLKQYDGVGWLTLPPLKLPGQVPTEVEMTSNWAGDIVLSLLSRATAGGGFSLQVYRLSGSQLTPMGPAFRTMSQVNGHAVTFDARGPVVAWLAGGFVEVRRWNGSNWLPLGLKVNDTAIAYIEAQSPALAVTGDGKLVVAYTQFAAGGIGIAAKVWNGTGWTPLGQGVPAPSRVPSLGGENSGAPVVAFLKGYFPQFSRWDGSAWSPPSPLCIPPTLGQSFGAPALAVRFSQPVVVCGLLTNTFAITGRRTLVARALSPLVGWEPLGRGPINGAFDLAPNESLAYVMRLDPEGRPWVAWTAAGGSDPGIVVSALVAIGKVNQP